MEPREISRGTEIRPGEDESLYLLERGAIEARYRGRRIETVLGGGYFGEDLVMNSPLFSYSAAEESVLYSIPATALQGIPIVRWKLLESLNKRIRLKDAIFPV